MRDVRTGAYRLACLLAVVTVGMPASRSAAAAAADDAIEKWAQSFLKQSTVARAQDYMRDTSWLVKEALRRDRKLANSVFDHAASVLEQFRRERGLSRPRSYLPQLVGRVLRADRDNLATMSFLYQKALEYDCYRSLGSVHYDLHTLFRRKVLDRQLRLRKEGIDLREAEDEALITTVAEFCTAFRGVKLASFGGHLSAALSGLSSDRLPELLQWSEAGPEPLSLRRKVGVIAGLLWARRLGTDPASEPQATMLRERAVAHYRRVLEDESLSAVGRYHVSKGMLFCLHDRPARTDLLLLAAKAFLAIDSVDHTSTNEWCGLAGGLSAMPPSEKWRQVAEPFVERWEELGEPQPRYSRGSPALPTAMAEIHFRLGHEAAARSLLTGDRFGLMQFVRSYVMPLKCGQAAWCAERLAENWRSLRIYPDFWRSRELRLTPASRVAADEVVENMPSPDLEFLADALYASLSVCEVGSNSAPDSGKMPRQPRLDELVEQFTKRKFTDPAVRQKCIDIILQRPYLEKLRPLLLELCARDDLAKISRDSSPRRSLRQLWFVKYLSFLLDEGDVHAFREHVQKLKPTLANRPLPHTDPSGTADLVKYAFVAAITNGKPPRADLRDYLTAGLEVHHLPGDPEFVLRAELFHAILSLHYLCDREDQLQNWWDGLPKWHKARRRARCCQYQHCLPVFAKVLGGIREDNASDFLRRFLSFSISPRVVTYSRGGEPAHKVLLQQEYYAREPEKWQLVAAAFYQEQGRADLSRPIVTHLSEHAKEGEIREQALRLLNELGPAEDGR